MQNNPGDRGDRLTDAVVRSLAAPASGNRITYDRGKDAVRGFGFRVTAAGVKAFVLNYTIAGRERRYTIGGYPAWTVAAARDEAKRLRRDIDRGIDPLAERIAQRTAPTVKDLATRYEEDYLPKKRPSSQRNDRTMLKQWIVPELGSTKVEAVRSKHIEDLHRKITKAGTPIMANRVVALLSKLFSLAIRWEMRGPNDNPVKGAIERNAETKRKVYLKPRQIARLSIVLAHYPDQNSADAVRLLLLTGARRSEALGARWDQFDEPDFTHWVKPGSTTKQKTEHDAPLNAPARELLVRRRATIKSDYVFPGRGTPHLTEIKKAWAALCKAAGLEGVRLHDLRHTAASVLVSGGATLPMIAALLGHSQVTTTNRYAHLYSDPLREAAERLGAVVTASDQAEPVEIVSLDRGARR
jgi:integrase